MKQIVFWAIIMTFLGNVAFKLAFPSTESKEIKLSAIPSTPTPTPTVTPPVPRNLSTAETPL